MYRSLTRKNYYRKQIILSRFFCFFTDNLTERTDEQQNEMYNIISTLSVLKKMITVIMTSLYL